MDERLTFQNAIREASGENDNEPCAEKPDNVGVRGNKYSVSIVENTGHIINIDKLELSIVLDDSKKKLTCRAIVLALRELLLSDSGPSKKATSYPPVDSSALGSAHKKNGEMFTSTEVNTRSKKTGLTCDNHPYQKLNPFRDAALHLSQKSRELQLVLTNSTYKKNLVICC